MSRYKGVVQLALFLIAFLGQSPDVHKQIVSAKLGFVPPPKGREMRKLYKSGRESSNLTLFGGVPAREHMVLW